MSRTSVTYEVWAARVTRNGVAKDELIASFTDPALRMDPIEYAKECVEGGWKNVAVVRVDRTTIWPEPKEPTP